MAKYSVGARVQISNPQSQHYMEWGVVTGHLKYSRMDEHTILLDTTIDGQEHFCACEFLIRQPVLDQLVDELEQIEDTLTDMLGRL